MAIWPLIISGSAILIIVYLLFKSRHEYTARTGWDGSSPETKAEEYPIYPYLVTAVDDGCSRDDV